MDGRSLGEREGVIPLARIFGIPLVADGSWLIQVALLTFVARGAIVDLVIFDPAPVVGWLVALALGLSIVACIVVHELAHSVVARAYGLPVRRIVLFMLGGVSQIEREAPGPRAEYHIAVAGPLASVVLATLLAGVGRALNPTLASVPGAWGWFAQINMALAVFNLLPAFPMDGGRVLRSALWAGVGDRVRATRWAAHAGQGFAGLLGLGGVGVFVIGSASGDGESLQAAWLVLLAVFLFNAAGAARRNEGTPSPHDRPRVEERHR